MIIQKIVEAAQPFLKESSIQDVVVGVSLIAVQLDNKNIGVSYVLRENLPAGCSVFPYAQGIIGRPAPEIAEWVLTGQEDLKRGIGMAVITAATYNQNFNDPTNSDSLFGLNVLPSDKVGMIGYIKPIAKELEKKAAEVFIFDMGMSLRDENKSEVYLMQEQPKILPVCDIVILSGTTMINNTADDLLAMCSSAREIIMVGSSTPMFPEAFEGTNVTVLAGAWWDSNYKKQIFRDISLACGISYLQKYVIKKTVRIR